MFYIGNAIISKYITFSPIYIKHIIIALVWSISVTMIKLYAPADTQEVPILRSKDRKLKRNLSYITMTLTLITALIVKNQIISNLLIFGTLLQTISITKFIYKLTKCKYGYAEYIKNQTLNNAT